jgi:anaerobic carbon-monoxide dehydrogenase, CODH/ACS complex subunit epsilon
MSDAGSWQTAEVGGPKKAVVIKKPEVVAAALRTAERPVLILGHRAGELGSGGVKMVDLLVALARAAGLAVIATGNASAALRGRDYTAHAVMPAVDAGNRLTDPAWAGIDGGGPYDLVLIAGLPYQMAWTILSGLKHFNPRLKTLSLDPGYQPHATWSLSNISIADWMVFMRSLTERIEQDRRG